ncbi:hypothetical protein ACS3YM_10540 [Nocardia sp. N13]|uniref:hypothetical protein n=1 Tax=Nocardioides sp. N13(2025) TaxID=3453405 RepID=UPI003F771C68
MITVLVRKVLPIIGIAVVLGACVRRIEVDNPASDMWFHLRLGREFLDGWSVSHPGHLGVYDSAQWVPTQWLSQMSMALAESAWGVPGVIWVTGAVQIILVLFVYVMCRREAAPLPSAITTGLSFLAMSIGLSPRPQVMSYLFVVVLVFAWLASARDGKTRWWLVVVAWAWAPIHGMWPLASILGAVCVLGIALDRRFDRRIVLRMALIPLASAAVPALTPAGFRLYEAVLLVGSRGDYFEEWQPTDFQEPYAVVAGIMLLIAFIHGVRNHPSWLFNLLLLTAAGWAVYASRTVPVAAAIAAPLVAQSLQSVVPTTGGMGRLERWCTAVIGLGVLAALVPVAVARGDDTVVPAWTDARLAALPDGARVLDDWANGPYYLWRHPDLSLVMHGYGDVFTDDEIERNRDIMVLNPDWDQEVENLEVDAAIVHTDTPLGYALSQDARWTVVEGDDDFLFLLPSD